MTVRQNRPVVGNRSQALVESHTIRSGKTWMLQDGGRAAVSSECSASSKEVGQPGTEWMSRPSGGQACGRRVYNVKLPQFGLLMKPGEGRRPYHCFTTLRCSRSNGAKHQWYRPSNCPAGAIRGAAGRPNLRLRLTCKLMRDYIV